MTMGLRFGGKLHWWCPLANGLSTGKLIFNVVNDLIHQAPKGQFTQWELTFPSSIAHHNVFVILIYPIKNGHGKRKFTLMVLFLTQCESSLCFKPY